MDPWYDIQSSSRLRCEKAVREARTRHLVQSTRADRRERSGRRSMGLIWKGAVSLVRLAQLPELRSHTHPTDRVEDRDGRRRADA